VAGPIGGSLAAKEWWRLTMTLGKCSRKEKASASRLLLYPEERERGAWSRTSAMVSHRLAGLAGTRCGDGSLVSGRTHAQARSV
jgi:hypothetical protein